MIPWESKRTQKSAKSNNPVYNKHTHSKPQKSFLIDMFDIIKKYNVEPIIDYFYYNKNIYNQINAEYGFSIDATKRLMQSHSIVNGVNESLIRQAYKADYDLIKSVKFKNI